MAAIEGPIGVMTTTGQDFQDNALQQFQDVLNDPDVEPGDIVEAAAKLKIDLASAQAIFDAAGKSGDFYRDVVSRALN
ncbi:MULTISPECIES: hypothetical protein [unclassified Limnobacter]|jgi:hypothetical protein|uniref:hypothetical protein n=1 Tax=unclassified Limnobacter TaxID=2630203 RepID=UPI000156CA3D|nr:MULTISPECIES: hypothetical protein [unclassified Limnobacter]EDM84576.1 hypothetical protein LMED105_03475 [Limnobacter sp. MED105]